jgi:hypothetical protein
MYALEGNSEFCFPENLNVSWDEVEGNIEIRGKTKFMLFPEGAYSTLSALLYSDEQKSTFNNIHTTIVFRDKNSIV